MNTVTAAQCSVQFEDLLEQDKNKHNIAEFYRGVLSAGGERINNRFADRDSAWQAIEARTRLVDAVLQHCWTSTANLNSLALVAVGGYGRRQLHPYSDVDVMILMLDSPAAHIESSISTFVTLLWDLGLDIGHSVRTVAQCVEESLRDVTVITNLLEARLVIGCDQLFEQMQANIARENIWSARNFFTAKRDEQRSRHLRYQDTSYRLEPNVKESPGGLRDIQTLRWISKRLFSTDDLQVLVNEKFLNDDELASLEAGEDLLCKIRFALHNIAERKEDRLLFDHQRELAHAFDYTVDKNNLCIEQFMQRYYRTVMALERLNEMLLQLFAEYFEAKDKPKEITRLDDYFQINERHIEVTHDLVFSQHPPALLGIFLLSAKYPQIEGVRADTIRLLRRHLHLIDDDFRANPACRRCFIELLQQPQGITHQLRRMNRYGVLAAYLPAFEKIVGRMQYDLFHIYTVDEHTLMVIRNMRRYFIHKHHDELPHCFDVARDVRKPELLFLMGLFHDIAKGRGGDHSELGAQDALEFCRHHELGAVNSSLVAWAVENHLLMSMTMQRRDISDPEVVYAFAQRVSSKTHLDYLYLLTVADIRGTDPALWNSWKDSLLKTLYNSTLKVLKRGLDNPINRNEIIVENKHDAIARLTKSGENIDQVNALWEDLGDTYFLRYYADEICWHTKAILKHGSSDKALVIVRQDKRYSSTEIFIYCVDQNNLFAQITTVMGRLSLNIISARIVTSKSQRAMDRFRVLDKKGWAIRDPVQLQQIKRDIESALHSRDSIPPTTTTMPSRRMKLFSIPVVVEFDNQVTSGLTSVTVIATDRPGALSRIAHAFLSCNVSVHAAKIATFGEKLEDVFFISHRDGSAVTAEAELQRIERALIEQLSE